MTPIIPINQKEKATQKRVIDLFKKELKYRYLGDLTGLDNKNVREDDLRAWLGTRGVADNLINETIKEFNKINYIGNGRRLYDANEDIYQKLRYGIKVKTGVGEQTQTVFFVDWHNPLNNDFAIAEEVSIKGENNKRPDIVLYINGIAMAVLELKRSSISVGEGIRQNLTNQRTDFIAPFFNTIQFVMAGNDAEGLRYGVIETGEKYYLTWKDEINPASVIGDLYHDLKCLCDKNRLIELIYDFMVFDDGIKKTCRPNQYFGIKSAQEKLKQKQGGIIWHTQGSGKSLTMVWLASWILEQGKNNRVLVITDRTELDEQIEKVFKNTNHSVYRTQSGKDLLEVLNKNEHALMCSLVYKFGRNGAKDEDDDSELNEYLADIVKRAGDFNPKGNIVVFVDECHRTQSGKLHEAMKSLLPSAIFIGFTGTPLLKSDKKQSVEVFGGFIHRYQFDEAVKDGVVLDLLYEARDIEQSLSSSKKIDEWFELKTRGLTNLAKNQVKQRWGTMQKLMSSKNRLEKIADDILMDMETKPRLSDGSGNAILVCSSVYQACQTYEIFSRTSLKGKVAIITSFKPNAGAIKGEGNIVGEEQYKYDIYRKMLAEYFQKSESQLTDKDPETFETEVKKRFIKQPAQMKLLIVVDKLLTGFDAPSATYLYIDKKMADHNLFQAICRVNRLDGESKTYGYIIDYRDLFKSLEQAFNDFTAEAFADFEKEDIQGLLQDRLSVAKKDLQNAWEAICLIDENILAPKDLNAYKAYFCGKDSFENLDEIHQTRRLSFYQAVAKFVRAFSQISGELVQAGFNEQEAKEWHERVEKYTKLKESIKIASGDYVDFKTVDADMRYLINQYVKAEDSEVLGNFENMGLLELLVNKTKELGDNLPKTLSTDKNSMAETIENNVRKKIVESNPINPKYFEKMSALLDELIEQRKKESIDYESYLKKVAEIARQVINPSNAQYPASIDGAGKRALFDNLCQDDEWVNRLHNAIQANKQDDYLNNVMKQRRLKSTLQSLIDEKGLDINEAFDLIVKQVEYH